MIKTMFKKLELSQIEVSMFYDVARGVLLL